MKHREVKRISLVVEDERTLYTPFSPDDEFNENVKQYIQSKFITDDYTQPAELIVISSSPIDEEKFRNAAANWIKEQKALLSMEEKNTTALQRALFIIGALIVILVTIFRNYFEPLAYVLILIIGTALMGKAVTNWYEQVPNLKAKKWLIKEMEKTGMIVFVHD